MGLPKVTNVGFDALSLKYGGFNAPVVKVQMGNDLISLLLSAVSSSGSGELLTDGVSVTLNKDSASSATFNVMNCYDFKEHKFKRNVSVGTRIAITLGYGPITSTVFAGYVDSVSYEFSDVPKMTVTAFDGVKLMMESGTTERTWDNDEMYVTTIMSIMEKYADSCPLLPTNIAMTSKKHAMLKQNSNDYTYIKDVLCKYCGRDLIMKNGYAYLVDYKTKFGKLTELGPSKGLLNLTVESGYIKVKATVTGDKLKDIHAESSISTGLSYSSAMNKPTEISKQAPFDTKTDCQDYADRLAYDAVQDVRISRGTCVGIPDILPGVGISYKNVDSKWDGKTYYVDTATHTLNSSGYTVSFTTKGWS